MLHHLVTPSLTWYAGSQIDLGPAPADCTELGLGDYQFVKDGADERDGVCWVKVPRHPDRAGLGVKGRRHVGRVKLDADTHVHPRKRRYYGT